MNSWSPARAGQAERDRKVAEVELTSRDDIKWLMADARGRRIARRMVDDARVLTGALANNTATVQSAIVAVHDFVMEHLVQPILAHCPDRLLEMRKENV